MAYWNYTSTARELEYLHKKLMIYFLYPGYSSSEIQAMTGMSQRNIYGLAQKLGVKKHREYVNPGCKKEGVVPWNKGKRTGFVPWNKGMKIGSHPNSVGTQFKKGQKSNNHLPIGSIQLRKRYKRSRHHGYYIKLAEPNVWKELKHYIWEKHNPPVPKGHVLRLINGDPLDVRIENMEVITMKENRIRNSASVNLGDGFVALTIAGRKRPGLADEIIKNHPELIELKRLQLTLKRTIHGLEKQT